MTDGSGIRAQMAYRYRAGSSATFAVHLLQFENVVTWQFRYDTGIDYSPPYPPSG